MEDGHHGRIATRISALMKSPTVVFLRRRGDTASRFDQTIGGLSFERLLEPIDGTGSGLPCTLDVHPWFGLTCGRCVNPRESREPPKGEGCKPPVRNCF